MSRRSAAWLVCAMCLSQLTVAAAAEIVVTAGRSEILFDEYSGTPVRWSVCESRCDDPAARRIQVFDRSDGYMRITTPVGPGGVFSGRVTESPDEVIVDFSAAAESYRYRIHRDSAELTVELPAMASIQFGSGSAFVPRPMPGFGRIYSKVMAVQVSERGEQKFDADAELNSVAVAPGAWTGVRNRYWALLVRPEKGAWSASIGMLEPNRPLITLSGGSAGAPAIYRMYAGPVAWDSLDAVDPALSEILFSALWDPLRWLCFGMLLLLEQIVRLVGSYGLGIILLSLAVKILMYPLTAVADRWQAQVNRTHSLLKPELDAVKRDYRGEEAHQRTLEVYRRHGVSPLYTFRSLAGFLVQIPVFIAAFDMLAENFALNEVSFLWIDNLARPDHIVALPVALPFFGGWLNLLPFLMTALSVLAAWLQKEDSLSPALQRQQSIRLYLMSAAFFVLFYTFPAGMVLYWTASNLFHLIKVEGVRLLAR